MTREWYTLSGGVAAIAVVSSSAFYVADVSGRVTTNAKSVEVLEASTNTKFEHMQEINAVLYDDIRRTLAEMRAEAKR